MADREHRDWANDWFRVMVLLCVRNTELENIHAGAVPVSHTGDFSDVTVVDADGRRIPWPEVSHFDDEAMKDLMRDIVNRLYTFHAKAGDPDFQRIVERWMGVARRWDLPELDEGFLSAIEARRAREKESSGLVGTNNAQS